MTRDGKVFTPSASDSDTSLSRRSLFQYVGMAIAAAALPPGAAPAAKAAEKNVSGATGLTVSPLMATLSTHMSEARNRALPAEVSQRIKLHVLDIFAAIISGSELPAGTAALKFARAYGGKEVSTILCSKVLCGPMDAALLNGTMAHADETDDVHPLGPHPGCIVVPATLAVAEQFGIDGTHFMRAVSLGYDIIPRMALAFSGVELMKSHARYTVFGAAAAAACAASLNEQQMRWVIDYTSQQSSGIRDWERDIDHIEKGFALAGQTARAGVTSALLIQSGWTGIPDAFSGPDNFFATYGVVKPEELINKLGEEYGVMGTSIKKWTVGHPMQAPMDAMYYLQQEHPFETNQVKQVVVRMASTTLVSNRDMPDICLQHMLAVMMIDKTVTFLSSHDRPRMKDPNVLRLRGKVQLVDDEDLKHRGLVETAIVEVTLTDGTQFSHRADAVRGTPQNPMTAEEIVTKARGLIAPVLGASAATALIDRVLKLESVNDIRELRPLLQKT